MAKLTLTDLSNLEGNPSSAQTAINANNAALETALENTLSRDGTSPNSMQAQLDMDSFRIINLPVPVDNQDPATKAYVDDLATSSPYTTGDEIGTILFNTSQLEINAGVTPSHKQYIWGDVRRYGALGDGTTDDYAAINQAISTGHPVRLEAKTYKISQSLLLLTGTKIQGDSAYTSILNYTGSGVALKSTTTGTRTYGWSLRDFRVNDAGTGTTGIEMDSVSMAYLANVQVIGFDVGVDIYSPTSGYAVYNTFTGVLAQGATGFKLRGTSSNQNVFDACRANLCTTRGIDITDSNGNRFYGCALESGGTGTAVYVTATGAGLSDANYFESLRIEAFASGTGINIASVNVKDTMIIAPYIVSTVTTPISDSGTRTQIWMQNANTLPQKNTSALADASGIPYYFERTTSASTNPAFKINDSNSSSGTPVTLNINTERSTGKFFSGTRAGVEYSYLDATGRLMLTGAAPTVAAGQIGIGATTASTVGAAGGASALPATPTGYLIVNIAGTNFKIPYYAN